MRFYKNRDTGQILKEPDARVQWREEYDGDDPTSAVRFFDQYSELKGRDLAITQIQYVIDTHEPADSYKYQLLDRLKTDCGYFLGAGNRNPASLWGCSVGTHLEAITDNDLDRLTEDNFHIARHAAEILLHLNKYAI